MSTRLEPAAERAYVDELLPHATVLTPNLREAEVLLGASVVTREDQRDAARALGALGPRVVVVKGGHAARPLAVSGSAAQPPTATPWTRPPRR